MGEVGVDRCHGLELNEGPEVLDLVEMDSHVAPKEQAALLGDDHGEANRCGERGQQGLSVYDLDNAVPALTLLWFVGALKLNEVRSPRVLLAQLETPDWNSEVAIALPDRASVLCAEYSTCLDRARGSWVCCLQLDVAPGAGHKVNCDASSGVSVDLLGIRRPGTRQARLVGTT